VATVPSTSTLAPPALLQVVDGRWLRRIVAIDLAAAVVGVAMVLLIRVLVVGTDAVLAAAAVVAVAGMVMYSAVGPARGLRSGAVVFRLAVANWVTALPMSVLAPFSWPLTVPAALIPAVLAATYTSGLRLWAYVSASMAVAVTAASLGELRAGRGLDTAVPIWLQQSILIGWTPVLGVVVALIAHQNSARLHSVLSATMAANRRLDASRRELGRRAAALRRSRSRIVTATERARRRIQRDLHDGAQQRLVALAMRVGALRDDPPTDPEEVRRHLADIGAELRAVQAELRALAAGMYPAALAEAGPAAALRAAVDGAPLPVRVRSGLSIRHDPTVEAAVYFCCLEAVQNATKHAGHGARVELEIAATAFGIHFAVVDDGVGFDPDGQPAGLGMDDMHDRIADVGGWLEIDSSPLRGTIVRGRVPAGADAHPPTAPPGDVSPPAAPPTGLASIAISAADARVSSDDQIMPTRSDPASPMTSMSNVEVST